MLLKNPLKLQSIVEYDVKTKKKRVLLYDELVSGKYIKNN